MRFKDILFQAKEFAAETAEKVKDSAAPAIETAKDKLNDASDFIGEKTETAKRTVIDKAEEISPEGVEKIREASDKVKSTTEKAATKVSETVEKAKTVVVDKAEELSPEGVEKVRETSDKIKEKTSEMNLFNSTIKKEAIEDLKKANEIYEKAYVDTVNQTVEFHESKLRSSDLLKRIENYINSIANSPKEIVSSQSQLNEHHNGLESLLNSLLLLGKTDYKDFSTEEKFNLGSMVNTAKALSEFLNKGLTDVE